MRNSLDKSLKNLLVVLMAIMVVSTLLQVFARFVSWNIPFTEELTIYAMMWVTLFGSALAFGTGKHIAIDLLGSSLPPEKKWKLSLISESIVILFAVTVLLIGGARFVYISFKLGQISSVMQISKGWVYLAIPISGLITILYNVLNIQQILTERK